MVGLAVFVMGLSLTTAVAFFGLFESAFASSWFFCQRLESEKPLIGANEPSSIRTAKEHSEALTFTLSLTRVKPSGPMFLRNSDNEVKTKICIQIY